MTIKYDNSGLTRLIGNTPMVRLNRFGGDGRAQILAKLEGFNPGGSSKDRIALSMIQDAEKKGMLKPGGTIIEPTSGNTGIGLAMIAANRGYKLLLTMPETMSRERRSILRAYGARIILTPGSLGMKGSVEKAEDPQFNPGYFMPSQFDNPANPLAHETTTGVEIWEQAGGEIDAFVAGVGTGGTITGVGRFLKSKLLGVQIIAVEPKESAVISGKKPGVHKIQGIGAGFIPKNLDLSLLDKVLQVSSDDAYKATGLLASQEGILAGISSGAAAVAALMVARDLGPGKTLVVVFPDVGDRYLSVDGLF